MDFERALLARRTTTNWDMAGAGGRSGSIDAAEPGDQALAARQRYVKALQAVGPNWPAFWRRCAACQPGWSRRSGC